MNARRARIALVVTSAAAAAAALVVAGRGSRGAPPPGMGHPAAFAWLRPRTAPGNWSMLSLPASPAKLPLPRGWRPVHGDPGTRTAVLRGPSGGIAGYLNATPRQGAETAADWSAFRPAHNRKEGDREVRLLAAAAGLRFRGATGSCVLDSYLTGSGNRYRELACIVAGRSATTVVVGAAPPPRWSAEAPTIERAIASFMT